MSAAIDLDIAVGAVSVAGVGSAPAAPPRRRTQPVRSLDRDLDAREIRRQLPVPADRLEVDVWLVFDKSGSMGALGGPGNDASGSRYEASLVGLEHLAAHSRNSRVRLSTFDLNSPLDIGWSSLRKRSTAPLEKALLSNPLGGSSCLGPPLAEVEPHRSTRPFALIVASDFELFDHDVGAVLARLNASKADAATALVFNSPPPAALLGGRIAVHHVRPTETKPADIARWIVETAITAQAARTKAES